MIMFKAQKILAKNCLEILRAIEKMYYNIFLLLL